MAISGTPSVFSSFFSFRKALLEEKENLLDRIRELEAKNEDRERLYTENEELKNLLGRNRDTRRLLAAVILRPPASVYDTLILDVGEAEGAKVGQRVLAYGTTAVGELREVGEHTSKAVLFSSPGEKISGMIAGRNIPVEVVGRGGGNFGIELPRSMAVSPGEAIVTPGVYGVTLGLVTEIISDPRDPFELVLVSSPVNAQELRFVELSL